MIPTLADMAPSPTAGDWAYNAKFYIELAIASFVAFAYFNNRDKAKKMVVEPTPIIVKAAENFVSKAEFDSHVDVEDSRHSANVQEHRDIFSIMSAKERGLRDELTQKVEAARLELFQDLRALTANVNQISNDVAALSAHVEREGKQVATIEADIKGILKAQ
jgi:hypothetical protein